MTQAATVHAGGAYGRRDEPELVRVGLASILVAMGFATLVVAGFVSFNHELVALFLRAEDARRETVLLIGAELLLFAALFQFADAGQAVALSLLRGVQDTRIPMWLAAFAYWCVGVPAGYLFAFRFGLGPAGVWLGLTAGLGTAALLLMLRFWRHGVRIGLPEGARV